MLRGGPLGSLPGAWPPTKWAAQVKSSSPMGSQACWLTFGDPSVQPPDVESIIKINSRQTVASFPGLPELGLGGKDGEQR